MEKGEVELINEPKWVLFQMEEWEGYGEKYIRTLGELSVAGTIQNVGMGEARNIILIAGLYEDKNCSMCVYEGESLICPRLLAGAAHEFSIKHEFEYVHQGQIKGVKLGVSND